MPVPEALDWAAAGGFPEVFTTAHDALFTQAGLRPGERLLVHGAAGGVGTAAVQLGAHAPARASPPRCATRTAASRSPRSASTAIAPEGFVEQGPFDVILELVGAPNLADEPRRAGHRRAHRVIGVGARRQGRAQPARADGQARAHPRLDAARPPAGGEGARRPAASSARCCRCFERRRRSRVPVAETFPLDERGRGLRALRRRRQARQDRAAAVRLARRRRRHRRGVRSPSRPRAAPRPRGSCRAPARRRLQQAALLVLESAARRTPRSARGRLLDRALLEIHARTYRGADRPRRPQ